MIKLTETELGSWYSKVVKTAELADYSLTRGDIVIRPYGFAIWQSIVDALNLILQRSGHQQAYFPLFIPESLIEEEKNAVVGLSPRVFTVTEGGGMELSERLIVRPTSETIVNSMFSQWVQSYRDLPQKLYQWSNIARWEERARPFIKGREILWLEGHTVHATHEEAIIEIDDILKSFKLFINDALAIPVKCGKESESRKFVGSMRTFTLEAMTPNGQALQLAAVYDLGQLFSKIYNVQYQTLDNNTEFCWATNWGLGFRLIGALVLMHGDERGLRLPPNIAPTQIIVLPVTKNNMVSDDIKKLCQTILSTLSSNGIRACISDKKLNTVKQTIEYWEMKGIPGIIIIGDKEVATGKITILRRDRSVGENRVECNFDAIENTMHRILREIQDSLYAQANEFQQENTLTIKNSEQLEIGLNCGWVVADWCATEECEEAILEKHGKVIRCMLSDADTLSKHTRCFACNKKATQFVLLSKAY